MKKVVLPLLARVPIAAVVFATAFFLMSPIALAAQPTVTPVTPVDGQTTP